MVDWGNLKSLNRSQDITFEELCCQIFRAELGHKGSYRRIGKTGVKQKGVEAIIIKSNKKEIGIQAKCFYPGSISQGGRRQQVERSLKDAKKRKNLEKLIVCMPIILNEENTSGWGWWSKLRERLKLPFKLELWDSDKLQYFLTLPRHIARYRVFFGVLGFSQQWFKRQTVAQINNVGSKYQRELHVEGESDRQVQYLLGSNPFRQQFDKQNKEMKTAIKHMKMIWSNIKANNLFTVQYKEQISTLEKPFIPLCTEFNSIVKETTIFIKFLEEDDYTNAMKFRFKKDILNDDQNPRKKYIIILGEMIYQLHQTPDDNKDIREKQRKFRTSLREVQDKLEEFYRSYQNILQLLRCFQSKQLIILSRPGMGKTHLVCRACENQIDKDKPAILLLGANFTTVQSLKIQIKEQLGISSTYNWDEMVDALEIAAETHHSRLLFVIDALNECPLGVDIWRTQLTEIITDLTKSAWLCTVVTTRDSYAEEIFGNIQPKNSYYLHETESIDSYRSRYLEHFKIKMSHVGYHLSKGLENRFFVSLLCKTRGDPTRRAYSKLDVQDITIADVFEEYIRKCDYAICNKLKIPSGCSIIRKKLLSFAKYLWRNNVIRLTKYQAIKVIDDKDPAQVKTHDSLTFAIIHEGLLLDMDWASSGEVIEFTHQLLGEYLMAVNFVENKSKNEIKVMLQKKYTHPRLLDVMEWIAFLLPQKINKYLFEVTPLNATMSLAQEAALFEMPYKFITKRAVSWIYQRFKKAKIDRKMNIFTYLFNVAYIPKHPLNAVFLDRLLMQLPMPDRDKTWSEWIRLHSSILSRHVDSFESICRGSDISEERKDILDILAYLFMWFLTSTNRILRDKTTRALYWFGRRFPCKLFELTEQSLGIDDYYVPERMLAASYGITMALAHPLKSSEFRKTLFPFTKKLYRLMFVKHAPYSTTHILMRDYAKHLTELSLVINPRLLTKSQKTRITSPFKEGGIRNWKHDKVAKTKLASDTRATYGFGPIHSDFSRYIIGSISKRGNFQRKNFPTLKESVSMIIWRMKQLGYNERKFSSIDQSIARDIDYRRYGASEHIDIERYGKKYSWIAYFELAGFYADKFENGENWKDLRIRTSDVDIDPSFPEEPQIMKMVTKNYLKGKPKTIGGWIKNGPLPNIKEYLILDKINKEEGPWVLIDGYVNQEDTISRRSIFIFPRGFFINDKYIDKFLHNKRRIMVAGRSLPEIEDDIYTFAGEIPWCETFPYTKYPKTITILLGKAKRNVPIKKGLILLIEALQKPHKKNKGVNYISAIVKKINSKLSKEDQLNHEDLRNIPKEEDFQRGYIIQESKRFETFNVEVAIRNFGWESYHSAVNYGQNAYVPSKELAVNLELYIKPQSFDMLDKNGQPASITVQWGQPWHTRHILVYLRKDLFDEYLKRNNKQFVWIVWGERRCILKDDDWGRKHLRKFKSYQVYKTVIPYSKMVKTKYKLK